MSKQPEALRLAGLIEHYNSGVHSQAIVEDYSKAADELRRLHALTEPEQEPVAWMCSDESMTHKGYSRFARNKNQLWNIPVYISPPTRKPLTDEEIDNLELPPNGCTMRELVRAVERAHGITE
jgi:hypothetical protein